MKLKNWDQNLKVRLVGESIMNISYWMFFPFLTIYFSDEFGKNKAGFLLIFSQVFSVLANLLGGYCATGLAANECWFSPPLGRAFPFSPFL